MTDPQNPAQDPAQNPARWAADPTGRHQYRYWDGAGWTDQVSDNGVVSVDPPVASPTPAPAVPAMPAMPVTPSSSPPPPGGWAAAAAAASGAPAATAPPGVSGVAPGPGFWGRRDPTAVLGRRYGAFFIDLAICLVAMGILFSATATQRTVGETFSLDPRCHYASDSSSSDSHRQIVCPGRTLIRINDTVYETDFAWLGLFLLFTIFYFAIPEAAGGATLGKLMTGIRVVREDGTRIGFGRSLLRWLLFWVDGPITLFLCGIITSATSSGHRRVGDMAAGSYVVAKPDAGQPVVVPPR
jgi:uncharacterized RDD family membrane protein YckC